VKGRVFFSFFSDEEKKAPSFFVFENRVRKKSSKGKKNNQRLRAPLSSHLLRFFHAFKIAWEAIDRPP